MDVEVFGNGHTTAQPDAHMLVFVDLRLDVFKDPFSLVHFLSEHFQVFILFEFDHLEEGLADLHVVGRDLLVFVEGYHRAPLLLEHHVESADPID